MYLSIDPNGFLILADTNELQTEKQKLSQEPNIETIIHNKEPHIETIIHTKEPHIETIIHTK